MPMLSEGFEESSCSAGERIDQADELLRKKWRILLVHNAYQERGGEDSVVAAETDLLVKNGHDVDLYSRHNDELSQAHPISAAANALWSRRSAADLRSKILDCRPDIIHVHNTFPLISPSIYWTASASNIPVIQTLHNFRLLCPQAQLLREGKICEACVGKIPWRAVSYACYRNSRLQSAVSAVNSTLHRAIGTYDSKVTRYIALNDFCRRKFIEGGLPADRISIKPNFVYSANQTLDSAQERIGGLFVGRLSEDKGLDVLLKVAAARSTANLSVVGVGRYEKEAAEILGRNYLGFRSLAEILGFMTRAAYLVVPSIWYENFPRTIVEAYSCGLPVIASRLGALAEIVREGETGLLFNPGDPQDLAAKLQWADENPLEMKRMGQNSWREYRKSYSPEENYRTLMTIYAEALSET